MELAGGIAGCCEGLADVAEGGAHFVGVVVAGGVAAYGVVAESLEELSKVPGLGVSKFEGQGDGFAGGSLFCGSFADEAAN